MASANLDITERLDITCRQGDTFELTLTLKDSSGTALALSTDNYRFLMQVRSSKSPSRTTRSVGIKRGPTNGGGGEADPPEEPGEGIIIGSVGSGSQGPVNFDFKNVDNNGNVTLFVSALDMRKVRAGKYRYDFQYIVGSTHKTVLEGVFRVNADISKAIS